MLTTGKDEWGVKFPLSFKSFGDYKPPGTAYLTIPSIAIFGLNEFAIRFPAAFFGSLTILLIYFLTKEVFLFTRVRPLQGRGSDPNEIIALLAAALLAISPWHLHFSRMSMLVGMENFFLTLGVLAFLKFVKHPRWLFVSVASFSAAIYTYYGSRVTVPLLLTGLAIIFYRQLWVHRRHVILAAILGIILLSPLLWAIIKDPFTLTGRAKYMSVFYNDSVRSQLWETHTLDGNNFSTALSRFFHNKPYFYFRDIARRYLSHFSFSFWVTQGDYQPPFQIPHHGQFYLIDLVFVFIGLYYAVKSKSKPVVALLMFLFVSPVTSSLTFITPAANRSFNLVIGWTILTAFGMISFLQRLKPKFRFPVMLVFCILYLISFIYFAYQYIVIAPQVLPHQFYYGTRQLVQKLSQYESKYDQVVVSGSGAPLYIYLLFYNQYSPQVYWQTRQVNPVIDNLGWLHIDSFGKYVIPRYFDWHNQAKSAKVLYIGYQEEIPDDWSSATTIDGQEGQWQVVIDTKVLYPNGQVAYKIAHLELSH